MLHRSLRFFIIFSWLCALASAPLQTSAYGQDLGLPGKEATDIDPHAVIVWDVAQAVKQADGSVLVGLRLTTHQNFSIYKSRLTFDGPSGYIPRIGTEPASRQQPDPMGEGEIEVFDAGDFELIFSGDRPYTASTIKFRINFLGCTGRICLFPATKEFELPVYDASPNPAAIDPAATADVSTEAAAAASAAPALNSLPDPSQPHIGPASEGLSFEEKYAEQLKDGRLPWALVLLVVFLGGVATNITPCVFPMIPITIRLLGKQGHRPIAAALVYASGIVVTYTGLGLLASLSGGIFGSLLSHPLVNIVFALLFILLGFTMLGFGNFSKLQNFGAQLGSGQASYLNAFGMGAGAGLVAAPCTGPIMGALLAYATQLQSTPQAILLFFLYSLGFALPYVFLGLVAHRVAAYKVSPKLQVAVKMIFAAAMFALAVYYLKNTAHEALLPLQGQWRVLTLSLLSLSSVLIVVVVRHGHLIHVKSAHLLPAVLLASGLFSGIQWATGGDIRSELHWFKSESEAYARAAAEGKPILIDGWADWCVACKKMDQTTFNDPSVISLLQERWVLVKLDLTETNDATEALAEKYGMQGLPSVILVPSGGDLSTSFRFPTGYVTADRLLRELHAFTGK